MMPKDEDVVGLEVAPGMTAIRDGEVLKMDAPDTSSIEFNAGMNDLEEAVKAEEPKPFKWHGVDFPAWAQGPHFVMLASQTFALAIDPNCVTMEMKSHWMLKYVPELVQLGKKVLEKLLDDKIGRV